MADKKPVTADRTKIVAEFIAEEVGFATPGMEAQAEDLIKRLEQNGYTVIETDKLDRLRAENDRLLRDGLAVAADNKKLDDDVERLRAAGDELAHALSTRAEWTCCADGLYGPCDCPTDVARHPTESGVAEALDTWREAWRER